MPPSRVFLGTTSAALFHTPLQPTFLLPHIRVPGKKVNIDALKERIGRGVYEFEEGTDPHDLASNIPFQIVYSSTT